MLLRGAALPAPALTQSDVEVIKGKMRRGGGHRGGHGRNSNSFAGRDHQRWPTNNQYQPRQSLWQPPPPGGPGFGIGVPPPPPGYVPHNPPWGGGNERYHEAREERHRGGPAGYRSRR